MTRPANVISTSITTAVLSTVLSAMPAVVYAGLLMGGSNDAPATKVATLYSEHEVSSLDFSPDGQYLAAASYRYSTTMHLWDWRAEKQGTTLFDNKKLNSSVVNAVRYSPNGRIIGWCGDATPIWSIDTGEVVFQSEHNPSNGLCRAIGFSQDGKSIFLALVSHPGRFTTISVRDTSSWRLLWEVRSSNFFASTMSISPNGGMIAVGGTLYDEENTRYQVRIIDVVTRAVIRTIEPISAISRKAMIAVGDIQLVEWNLDGTQIAVGLSGVPSDGLPAVRIYDSQTGEEVASEPAPRGTRVRGLCYSPNGKYLIELGIGKVVKIWDAQHKKLLQEISANPTSCAISKDGRYLALGGSAPSLSEINPLLSLMFPGKGKMLIYELR